MLPRYVPALPDDLQVGKSALSEDRGMGECLTGCQAQGGQSLAEGLKRDLALLSCQEGPDTEVDAVAKRQVAVGRTLHVELVRVRELALVAVGRPIDHH